MSFFLLVLEHKQADITEEIKVFYSTKGDFVLFKVENVEHLNVFCTDMKEDTKISFQSHIIKKKDFGSFCKYTVWLCGLL